MTYNKKRMLSYGVILISVLLAYFCRLVRPKNTFARPVPQLYLPGAVLCLGDLSGKACSI